MQDNFRETSFVRQSCEISLEATRVSQLWVKQDENVELSHWYALVVRHQHERHTQTALEYKRLEALAPTYRSRRRWSDRTTEVELPLFTGYIFCRFPSWQRVQVLQTPGVVRIVSFGEDSALVADSEIAGIRAVMESKLPLRPWPYLKPGDRVRVERGPLRGTEGTLLQEKSSLHLVIGVELLQRSIAVELDPEMVVPVKALRAAG